MSGLALQPGMLTGEAAPIPFDPTDPKWKGLFINESEREVYGPFNAPSLDWNPASGEWDSIFGPTPTFSRASTAPYYDSEGVERTAAINEPRIDYNPSTLACRGYLVEPLGDNSPDVANLDVSSFWNTIGMMVYIEFELRDDSLANQYAARLYSDIDSTSFTDFLSDQGNNYIQTTIASSLDFNHNSSSLPGVINRSALSLYPADYCGGINGIEVSSATPASIAEMTDMEIGHYGGEDQLNGWIRRVIIWNKHQDDLD